MNNIVKKYHDHLGPRDERLEKDSNRIYKYGFVALAIFCLAVMYYQGSIDSVSTAHGIASSNVAQPVISPISLLAVGLIVISTAVGIGHVSKGIVDSNRFADAESFSVGYYGLWTLASALVFFLVMLTGRVAAEAQILGVDSIDWTNALLAGVVSLIAFVPIFFIAFFVMYKMASKRRDKLTNELDN